ERRFLAAFPPGPPHLMVWPRADSDGTPWLCVSMDVSRDGRIQRTFRVDYDGQDLVGGLSPAFLNWDDGVRATDAGIDTTPPLGISASGVEPEVAARLASDWFRQHDKSEQQPS
ncbi:MAG TPA: hypothetical protein VGW38_00790, partial [Chloroflexota bacterium]|nr:hypothetical protein [Chloroflexota bacterium]